MLKSILWTRIVSRICVEIICVQVLLKLITHTHQVFQLNYNTDIDAVDLEIRDYTIFNKNINSLLPIGNMLNTLASIVIILLLIFLIIHTVVEWEQKWKLIFPLIHPHVLELTEPIKSMSTHRNLYFVWTLEMSVIIQEISVHHRLNLEYQTRSKLTYIRKPFKLMTHSFWSYIFRSIYCTNI